MAEEVAKAVTSYTSNQHHEFVQPDLNGDVVQSSQVSSEIRDSGYPATKSISSDILNQNTESGVDVVFRPGHFATSLSFNQYELTQGPQLNLPQYSC